MGDFCFFEPEHEYKSTAGMEPSDLVQETWLFHVPCQAAFRQLELAPELWTKLRTSAPSSGAAAGEVPELALWFTPVCPALRSAAGLARLGAAPGVSSNTWKQSNEPLSVSRVERKWFTDKMS